MRIDYGFDLLDMSALTTYHSGRLIAQLLSREPFVWYISYGAGSGHTFRSCLADTATVLVWMMLLVVLLRGYHNG